MRASVLLFALSLDAQFPATLIRLPDGREEIKVHNQSEIDVAAFAVKVMPSEVTIMRRGPLLSHGPLVMFFDPTIDQSSALAANEERSLMVRGPAPRNQRIFEEPIVTAGLFADGTTAGDIDLLTRLLTRRRNALQAVETSLELFASEIPRNQMMRQFEVLAQSARHWYLAPDQQIGLRIYQPIFGKLKTQPDISIESLIEQLRKQRNSLLESKPSITHTLRIDTKTAELMRSGNQLQAVETTLEILADAGRRNIPRIQLIRQFQLLANSVSHRYLPLEQRAGSDLYQSIIGKLKTLPEGQLGEPFPPTAFVEKETAVLREQRAKLMESQPSLADASFGFR